jgi:type II secretion system protein I
VTARGSILLEVLLAIAIFAFAGVVVLGVMQETVAAGARAERRALAMDLARTRLADVESGMVDDEPMAEAPGVDPRRGLRVEHRLEPSEHVGLALVVVEVWDDATAAPTALAQAMGGSSSTDAPRLAVLRQLIRSEGGGGPAPRPEFGGTTTRAVGAAR